VKLAHGDAAGAAAILAKASQSARQHNFVYRIPEVAALQVLTLLSRVIWRQRRIWLRRTNSASARPGYIWPREIRPQH